MKSYKRLPLIFALEMQFVFLCPTITVTRRSGKPCLGLWGARPQLVRLDHHLCWDGGYDVSDASVATVARRGDLDAAREGDMYAAAAGSGSGNDGQPAKIRESIRARSAGWPA